ncbi:MULTISPECIES: Ig-like domain-containing protein [unclassified Isoptericola]|uniref:Ig-like domain-containing protein n=1 Tax=unclassified Isoptericola TaxID=2623355 RepID=UPI00365348B9
MSLLSRLRADRRASISTTVVLALTGGVVAAAVLYQGEATADVDLDDSGVWVTNESSGLVGRFNTEARSLDGTMLAGSSSFDVDQQASQVLVSDGGSSTGNVVDPARLKFASSTGVPAGARTAMGGGRVAVVDDESGSLWVTSVEKFGALDTTKAKPTADLDGAARAVVSETGIVYAVVPARDVLWTLEPGKDPRTTKLDGLTSEGDDVVLTTVGDDLVVLDRTREKLRLPGGDLVDVPDAQGAQLQLPGVPSASVAYATTDALVLQPLGGGAATQRKASGTPAQPVQLGGCLYGAWSGTGQIARDCEGTDRDVDQVLEGIDQDTRLAYRVNRNNVVLNDLSAGTLWMAMDEYEKVDDWDVQLPEEGDGDDPNADDDTPEMVDQSIVDREKQDPPIAKDDKFGVRPGRATVLDVLNNDLDPDGDVITASLAGDQPEGMTVQEVLGGAALQAVVPEGATGTVHFPYVVTDGRGGHAEADVSLRVVPWSENEAPEQRGEPVLTVPQGGKGEIRVLSYFRDPDGDDLLLGTASSAVKGDEVRTSPDGTVEFRDDGKTTGRKKVALTVNDGQGKSAEGTLWVDVVGATQKPPVAVGDHVVVTAGQPVTVEPLKNDSDPNGDDLRLSNVSEAAPAKITPNYEAGTFTFLAQDPKSYDVLYQVTDGSGQAPTTGVVRVDVVDPQDATGDPVVVADTALLPAGGSTLVDVLANDSDPAGGVLVVQSVDVPEDAGVAVAVLGHQMLRVTESRRIAEPITLTYTVSNGTGTAEGQVRVLPVPAPARLQPPSATADEVTVHVNDYANVDVLDNDTHPDGLELTLDDELVQTVKPEQGEAFVSEGVLRFRAGTKATTAYVIYTVTDENGQEDSAQVTIHVRDGKENRPPVPPDAQARVVSGGTVRVQVPLDGIDPDGDSVQLVNLVQPPVKGIAEVVDGRYIDFKATRGVTGQDALTYAVVDARGEKAEGTVRIGIAPPPTTNHPPLAEDDVVTARPGRNVVVPALRNDSDPDGDQFGLVPGALEAKEPLAPKVEGDRVLVRTPDDEGSYGFYYAIEDTWGARAMGAVTLEVSEDAPLLAPIARDDIVMPGDVKPDQSSVTVKVLDNDEDPDGAASELKVEVGGDTATVGADGDVAVRLLPQPQILTYTVTDQDGLQGKAFIQVPASKKPSADDQDEPEGPAPMLKPNFSPLKVKSGEPLTVNLGDAVVVAEGGKVAIADSGSASAVAGSVVVKDKQRLVYTSDEDYVGPAAVGVLVTDGLGDGPEDDAHTAMVQVPITVLPPENLPPEPGSPTGQVAAGEESTVDLARFATDPDQDELSFSLGGAPAGVSASLTGSVVTLQADADVAKGTSLTIPFTVNDGENAAVEGTLTATVVASTRPLPKATPDTVEGAHQGKAVAVPVLANDIDPFDPKGLEVIGSGVQTGAGEAVVDGDQVVVTPDGDFVGTLVATYRIQDATKDADRIVEGRITVTVLGVPEAPATPVVEEVRSETVVLSWTPPLNNGADITGYTVTSNHGDTFDCATTTCTLEGLTNNVKYTFTVVATNEVGDSPASPASAEARPDEKPDPPAAPTLAFGDKKIDVTWVNATYTDRSPIKCVNLRISPAPASGIADVACVTGQSYTWEGLTNGNAYTVTVQAVNEAPDPSDWGAPSAEEIPAGVPLDQTAPSARRVDDVLGGRIDVSWSAPNANGDAAITYHVTTLKNGSAVKTETTTSTSYPATGLDNESKYTFTVVPENKAGKGASSPASNAVVPYGRPEAPTGVKVVDNNGVPVVSWNAADANGSPVTSYTVYANGARATSVSGTSTSVTGLTEGQTYSFQVTATNAGGTSGLSAKSGSVKVYAKPSVPTVTWTQSGATDGYFTVSGPSSWHGDTGTLKWTLTGSDGTKTGTSTGRIDVSGSPSYTSGNKSYGVTVTATNGAGSTSASASGSTTAPPPPNPQISVSAGPAYSTPGCTNTSVCHRFHVNTNGDFPAGTYNLQCWSTYDGLVSDRTYTVTLGPNGGADLWCTLGRSFNAQVWVTVNGNTNWSVRTNWPW